jgi:hypothetical protein
MSIYFRNMHVTVNTVDPNGMFYVGQTTFDPNDIIISPIKSIGFTCPYSQLCTLASKLSQLSGITQKIDTGSIDSFIQSINVIHENCNMTLKYVQKYIEIKVGVSVMGAIGIIAKLHDNDVDFTARIIEATHNTPQMYNIYSVPMGPCVRSCGIPTLSGVPRGLSPAEINQLSSALSAKLSQNCQMLLA